MHLNYNQNIDFAFPLFLWGLHGVDEMTKKSDLHLIGTSLNLASRNLNFITLNF